MFSFLSSLSFKNDRITKLKIDNNPFAKGFRETGQSKCKRKMMSSPSSSTSSLSTSSQHEESDDYLSKSEDDRSSVSSFDSPPQQKRFRSLETSDEESSAYGLTHRYEEFLQNQYKNQQLQYMNSPSATYYHPQQNLASTQLMQQHLQSLIMDPLRFGLPTHSLHMPLKVSPIYESKSSNEETKSLASSSSPSPSPSNSSSSAELSPSALAPAPSRPSSRKRNNFSISAILAY